MNVAAVCVSGPGGPIGLPLCVTGRHPGAVVPATTCAALAIPRQSGPGRSASRLAERGFGARRSAQRAVPGGGGCRSAPPPRAAAPKPPRWASRQQDRLPAHLRTRRSPCPSAACGGLHASLARLGAYPRGGPQRGRLPPGQPCRETMPPPRRCTRGQVPGAPPRPRACHSQLARVAADLAQILLPGVSCWRRSRSWQRRWRRWRSGGQVPRRLRWYAGGSSGCRP